MTEVFATTVTGEVTGGPGAGPPGSTVVGTILPRESAASRVRKGQGLSFSLHPIGC